MPAFPSILNLLLGLINPSNYLHRDICVLDLKQPGPVKRIAKDTDEKQTLTTISHTQNPTGSITCKKVIKVGIVEDPTNDVQQKMNSVECFRHICRPFAFI